MDYRINFKRFIKEHFITLIFVVLVLISLITTNQDGIFVIIENLMNKVMGFALITVALIIPINAGMGFNFSIGVGAIAAQFAIIIAVSLQLSGFIGILFTVILATILALMFGYITGLLLNNAKGHEMITSLFIGYTANGIYQYVLLFLFGSKIPVKASELILSSGTGIRNTIDLKSTLFKSSNGMLEAPAFFLLFVASIGYLIFLVIKLRSDKSSISISSILLSPLCLITSGIIMYTNCLPYKMAHLKSLKLPIISIIIILALILCYKFFIEDRITPASVDTNNKRWSSKKLRVTSITLSTILAAWGQLIFLYNLGILNTYGAHVSISLLGICALIIGGATLRHATVKHGIRGLILIQAFLIITLPQLDGNVSSVLRVIILNSVYVYVFTKKYYKSTPLEPNAL